MPTNRWMDLSPGVEDLAYHCRQLRHHNGLIHKRFDAYLAGGLLGQLVAVSGTDDDRQIRSYSENFRCQFIPGYLRHGHIGDHQIKLIGIGPDHLKSQGTILFLIQPSSSTGPSYLDCAFNNYITNQSPCGQCGKPPCSQFKSRAFLCIDRFLLKTTG